MAIVHEYVPNNNDDDDDGDDADNNIVATAPDISQEDEDANINSMSAPTLSKSWKVQSSHVPSYAGGKIVLCRGRGARHIYGIRDDGDDDDDDDDEEMNNKEDEQKEKNPQEDLTPFLLAQCGGDLSFIDALRGTRARTVRTGCRSVAIDIDDDEDDDDENLDRDAIISFALAPNDVDLITCTRSSILRQYDLSGSAQSYGGEDYKGPCKVKRVLGRSGHDLPVTVMSFHRSGVFFATGSVEGSVRVWDLRGGYITHSFRPGISARGGASAVTALEWCPDTENLHLAVGREDGTVRVHDLRAEEKGGEAMVGMHDHVSAVTCMTWAGKRHEWFVTAGRDAVINTWSVHEEEVSISSEKPKKKKKKKKDTEKETKNKIVYKRIRTLPVYEQVEGMCLLHNYHMSHSKVEHHDVVLATAGSKGIIRLWKAERIDSNDPKQRPTLSNLTCIGEQNPKTAFGEERGGYMSLLLTSHRHRLGQRDNSTEELIAVDAEQNLSFLPLNGMYTHSADEGGKELLNVDRTIVGHNDEILDLRVLPTPITPPSSSSSGTEEDNDKMIKSRQEEVDNNQSPRKIAVATNSAQIRIFEIGSYSCEVLDGHTDTVLALDVSPCGRYLATCGKDKTMRLWHLGTNRCVAVATGHTEAIGATSLSRKIGRYEVSGKAAKHGGGAFVVTASKDRTLKRWSFPGASELNRYAETGLNDGQEPLPLSALGSARAHEKDINIVSIAPNDSLIATGSQDKTIKLWRSTDLTLQATLKGHKRGIWDCQFSPFDRVLASCSGDRTVKLWSLGDYSCVRTFQGHAASALRVRFLSGGLQLLSSGADGLVKLWTIRTNECETTIDGHTDKVWALDLAENGKTLVSGGADSKIIVWKDSTKEEEDAKRDAEEQNILMEQTLSNHLRHKEYKQALEIALELDKPRQALKVFATLVENDITNGHDGLFTLQSHAKAWPMNRTAQVLRYCRDWNTRARNSHIALLVIKAIVSSIPVHKLASTEGIPEILAGITPYAERHFERIDRLYASSYLIDFTLLSMGSLDTNHDEDFRTWEAKSKLVLPPKTKDSKFQLSGTAISGKKRITDVNAEDTDDEVVTIGDSDTASTGSDIESESDSDATDDETSSSSSS